MYAWRAGGKIDIIVRPSSHWLGMQVLYTPQKYGTHCRSRLIRRMDDKNIHSPTHFYWSTYIYILKTNKKVVRVLSDDITKGRVRWLAFYHAVSRWLGEFLDRVKYSSRYFRDRAKQILNCPRVVKRLLHQTDRN